MSPAHANKGSKRYRYYVTHQAHVSAERPAWRVSAHDLETLVVEQLISHLGDPATNMSVTDQHRDEANNRLAQTQDARDALAGSDPCKQRELLLQYVERIELREDGIAVSLSAQNASGGSVNDQPTTLNIAAVRVRRGHDIRLVIAAPDSATPRRDARLVQLIADAIATRERLESMGDISISKAATWFGCCRSTLTERIKLSFLAPDIVEAILAGRQPRSLTRRKLAAVDLPIDWRAQRRILGFN